MFGRKLTQLPVDASPTTDDKLYVVDASSGQSRQSTIASVLALAGGGSSDLVKGYASTTTDTTGMTGGVTIYDLTGLSVSITAESDHTYLILGQCRFAQSGSVSNPEFRVRNAANTTLNRVTWTANAGVFLTPVVMAVDTPGVSGAYTYKLSASTGLGSLATTLGAGQSAFILVLDLGVL